jgi:hypothetical protein
MRNRDPLKFCSEIVRHLFNHISRQSLKINSVAELAG